MKKLPSKLVSLLLITLLFTFVAYAQNVDTIFNQGLEQFKAKQYEDALKSFNLVIAINSRHSSALFNIGLCQYNLERYSDSIISFNKAIENKFPQPRVYLFLGKALDLSDRYTEAVVAYQTLIRLEPNNSSAYYNLGVAHNSQKKYEDAKKAYNKSIELSPNDEFAHLELGNTLVSQKLYAEAEVSFRNALKINPNNASANLGLGNAFYNNSRYAESIPHYKKASELLPKWQTAIIYLADAYQVTMQLDLAVVAYKRAIELDPKSIDANYGLGLTYNSLKNKTALKQQIDILQPLDKPKADILNEKLKLLGQVTPVVTKTPVKPVIKTAQRIKDEKDVAALKDLGFDAAFVTGVSSIRETASKTGKVLLAVKRNDILSLSDKVDSNGFYQVVDEKTGIDGWIDGKTVVIKLTGNTENSGPALNDDGFAESILADPIVSITNSETKTTLKMKLNGKLYLIPPGTTKVVSVTAGKFTYYGWSPGIRPAKGTSTLQKGKKYSWNFKIYRRG